MKKLSAALFSVSCTLFFSSVAFAEGENAPAPDGVTAMIWMLAIGTATAAVAVAVFFIGKKK